jgi:hypothetical protein
MTNQNQYWYEHLQSSVCFNGWKKLFSSRDFILFVAKFEASLHLNVAKKAQ